MLSPIPSPSSTRLFASSLPTAVLMGFAPTIPEVYSKRSRRLAHTNEDIFSLCAPRQCRAIFFFEVLGSGILPRSVLSAGRNASPRLTPRNKNNSLDRYQKHEPKLVSGGFPVSPTSTIALFSQLAAAPPPPSAASADDRYGPVSYRANSKSSGYRHRLIRSRDASQREPAVCPPSLPDAMRTPPPHAPLPLCRVEPILAVPPVR